MPTYTTNYGFSELAQGDTVQSAVSSLNGNFTSLDGMKLITGAAPDAGDNGFHWFRIQTSANTSEDYVMMWGNFKFADSKYNTAYPIGDGTYKSIQSNSDTNGLVTLPFPSALPLSEVQGLFLFGGGDPDGANSPQSYAHLETEAVFLQYTTSGGKNTGVEFYWTCPRQETGASVWAKQANVLIIGRL